MYKICGDRICGLSTERSPTEKFEEKLEEHSGNLRRAAVALAQLWRSDKAARNLDALMIAADKESMLVISGTGEVIEPDEDFVAIGSGGNYAYAQRQRFLSIRI